MAVKMMHDNHARKTPGGKGADWRTLNRDKWEKSPLWGKDGKMKDKRKEGKKG